MDLSTSQMTCRCWEDRMKPLWGDSASPQFRVSPTDGQRLGGQRLGGQELGGGGGHGRREQASALSLALVFDLEA